MKLNIIMENPSSVNDQIRDTITQANVKVVAEAPALALGSLYQTMSNALSMSSANLVYAQQQTNSVMTSTVTESVLIILGAKDKKIKK